MDGCVCYSQLTAHQRCAGFNVQDSPLDFNKSRTLCQCWGFATDHKIKKCLLSSPHCKSIRSTVVKHCPSNFLMSVHPFSSAYYALGHR